MREAVMEEISKCFFWGGRGWVQGLTNGFGWFALYNITCRRVKAEQRLLLFIQWNDMSLAICAKVKNASQRRENCYHLGVMVTQLTLSSMRWVVVRSWRHFELTCRTAKDKRTSLTRKHLGLIQFKWRSHPAFGKSWEYFFVEVSALVRSPSYFHDMPLSSSCPHISPCKRTRVT